MRTNLNKTRELVKLTLVEDFSMDFLPSANSEAESSVRWQWPSFLWHLAIGKRCSVKRPLNA